MLKLIEDCLQQLKKNKEARNRYSAYIGRKLVLFKDYNDKVPLPDTTYSLELGFLVEEFDDLYQEHTGNYKHVIVGEDNLSTFALLSEIDGKPVMPFLDVNVVQDNGNGYLYQIKLDHLLYREFTEALRVGKSYDEALIATNELYKSNLKTN